MSPLLLPILWESKRKYYGNGKRKKKNLSCSKPLTNSSILKNTISKNTVLLKFVGISN
jgi:hypothetical protein